MTDRTPLSPAAQAVLDAVTAQLDWHARYHSHSAAAAALRAVADQVVPLHICGTNATRAQTRLGIRHKLLALATELENHQ
jgi:hypothetical protein